MKKIYLVFSETKNGKHYAHADTIKTGENLMSYIKRYPGIDIVHICETATQAAYLAAEWNKSYRDNNTFMFEDISTEETKTLYDVLHKLKMDDIDLNYDGNGLIATDSMNNVWHGKEFYKFLVDEAFVFEKDGSILGVSDELFRELYKLFSKNGVELGDPLVSTWDEYERVKKENPDAIVIYKIGDFFELFGARDTQIAHDVLDLTLTKKIFNNKSITTPMCGFPAHVTEQYVQKLLDAGNNVVAVTHEPGEKLEVRKIVSVSKELSSKKSVRSHLSELCNFTNNLHHAIVLWESPLDHTIEARDAFFREPVEMELWLQSKEYNQKGIAYATWIDGEFTNHGLNIEDEKL